MHPLYQFRNICKLHLSLLPSSLFRPSPAAGTARRCGLLACVVEQLRCSLAVYRVQGPSKELVPNAANLGCFTRGTESGDMCRCRWGYPDVSRWLWVQWRNLYTIDYRYHARLGQLSQPGKILAFWFVGPHTEDLLAIMKNDIVHCRWNQMYATSKKHVPRDSLCISWKSEYAVSTSTFGGSWVNPMHNEVGCPYICFQREVRATSHVPLNMPSFPPGDI